MRAESRSVANVLSRSRSDKRSSVHRDGYEGHHEAMTDRAEREFNERNIEEFRATGARSVASSKASPLLLLTSKGAKSGAQRVNPVAYFGLSTRKIYVVGSSAGRDRDPAWAYNLRAHPRGQQEIGADAPRSVTARELPRDERDRVYEVITQRAPRFRGVRDVTDRVIPVFELVYAQAAIAVWPPARVVGVGWRRAVEDALRCCPA